MSVDPILRSRLLASLLLGAALGLIETRDGRDIPATTNISANKVSDSKLKIDAFRNSQNPEGTSNEHRNLAMSAGYQAAWDSLHDGKRSSSERHYLQVRMLSEWCEVDLNSAIRAAMAEFEGPNMTGEMRMSLTDVCREGIGSQPELIWELIQGREFGMDTARLASDWVRIVGYRQPATVLERIPALHWRERWLAFLYMPRSVEPKVLTTFLDQRDPNLRRVYLDAYVRSLKPLGTDDQKKKLEVLPVALRHEAEQLWSTQSESWRGW